MKLSNSTMNILKNFAIINQGIVVNKDKPVYTKTVANSLLAKCSFTDLNETFALYDISGYLQTLSLFDSPDIKFNDKNMTISDGSMSVKRHYSSIDVIDYPDDEQISKIEELTDNVSVDFVLSGDQLSKITKASQVMKFDILTFVSDGSLIKAKLSDSTNCTADTFELDLGVCEREFNVNIFVDNLKCLPATYEISVVGNLIMLYNDSLDLTYWIVTAN